MHFNECTEIYAATKTKNFATHPFACHSISTRVLVPLRALGFLTVQMRYVSPECRGFVIHVQGERWQ